MRSRSTRPVQTTSNRLATCGVAGCSRLFAVCGSCDRGRRYCSDECAALARRAQTRRAGRCYQASERGRQAHAARQARYRAKRSRVTHQPLAGSFDLREISRAAEQGANAAGSHVARSPVGVSARGEVKASKTAARPPECAFCRWSSIFLRTGFHATAGARRHAGSVSQPRRGQTTSAVRDGSSVALRQATRSSAMVGRPGAAA
jgi:hypothetical protein